ncbi:restriction endonuclease subunit S [Klebsiella pneumoniae]|uniref:restriction endonuclease subunit S n=1 Tax=Klebsiella pneumoniae TaxID=573 RepID=UPI001EE8D097|nr:restriction endonuclease subunit S [Klebsiella pneumoniae]MCG5567079.1 restriction endonuclease subunit S [Klebsiella pneumoniae]HBR5618175.1 restriction endonuclease subunit S [Klebsiella pneumoniae]HBR5667641.1 restriction endonuclease subunit S [Klebsiella pneumoniae]HBR6719627.1 restriction endonuclease subunit S [Klebsiella pneumoniae]HCU2469627.1 restriction endonuclease subunit S [Klebsiella pneumoniae]
MSKLSYLEKLLDGVEVEWVSLNTIFDIFAGGDVPKDALSDIQTEEFNIPILSNGIGDNSLYGWTNQGKINSPSLTISARGTIGWTSYRDSPFYPIIRLLVLTPKTELNLKYAYYFMKMIEGDYKTPKTGIPQLTKPMLKGIRIPIPCPDNPEKSLAIQSEIVRILDKFTALTAELTAELTARKKQYNYYRDQLLSFDEGEVEWRTLGEITRKIASGRNKTRQAEGDFPVYGSTGLLGFTNEPAYSGDLLLVARVGAYAGLVNAVSGHFDVSDNTLIIHPSDSWNARFAFHQLTHMNLNQYAVGAGQPLITGGMLKNLKVPVPSLNEQTRIAKILDKFETITVSITEGLPREIELRQKQYEYYRDLLFSFPKPETTSH